MRRMGRIARPLLRILLAVAIVIVIAVGGLLAWVTSRAMPQTTGSISIAGLHAAVTVIRDGTGIAQIVADDPHDLFMAQGYVHAQDRFWQMEVWRHIGSGRISELFGEDSVDDDTFIRTLGWRQAAERDLEASTPDTRAALDAYAEGVNVWLTQHEGSLGLPFVLAGLQYGKGGGLGGYEPEPWQPIDSATFAKLQAFQLSDGLDTEVFHIAADARLGDPALTDGLFPAYPSDAPVEVPSKPGMTSTPVASSTSGATVRRPQPARPSSTEAARMAAAWRDFGTTIKHVRARSGISAEGGLAAGAGIGSNNWVVAPKKSATGHALLANDPHLGLGMPAVWYMNGLHCRTVSKACPYDAVGVSFPSVPAVILGHNARIAWGATNVDPDVQDLFEERIDPADPTHYLFDGSSVPFETRREVIKVAKGSDVTIDVRSTGHGPILSDASKALKRITEKSGTVYSLRWTATAEPDRVLDAFFAIDRAASWTDFRAALANYGAPSQNFVFADTSGHIGLQVPGLIPIRQDPADRGDRPRPGWDGKHEWTAYAQYDDLPHLFDPPGGVIVTANAAPVDDAFPVYLGRSWDPGYRASRIVQLLTEAGTAGSGGKGVTLAEMAAIQADTQVGRAPLVTRRLDDAQATTDDGRAVLEQIRSWDQRCPVESAGCAAYMAFEYRLLRGMFDDDLGDIARDYLGGGDSWQSMIAILDEPESRWWDDRATTDRTESMSDTISAALDRAGADLRSEIGAPSSWTWGKLHTITFREGTLGTSGIGPLEWYLNKGPFPVAGTAGAIDQTYYDYQVGYPDPDDPKFTPKDLRGVFAVRVGPSYRFTIDLGDLDGAQIVTTTGQSGNPFDRHYGDLIGTWLDCRQVLLPFSSSLVNATAVSSLALTP